MKYKIHGNVEKPESIIINSFDYESISKKGEYLAAKLMTIFMGYCIENQDIRKILQDIALCIERERLLQLQDRLIFIEWNENIKGYDEYDYIIFSGIENLKMSLYKFNDFGLIYEIISKNTTNLPVKTLRKLKETMYV